jgi:hypothetical protein
LSSSRTDPALSEERITVAECSRFALAFSMCWLCRPTPDLLLGACSLLPLDAWLAMRVLLVSAFLAAGCFGQAIGAWKLNPEKSRDHIGRIPRSITLRYEPREADEISTWYSVRADGTSETISLILNFDGEDYACDDPYMPEHADTVSSRRLDARRAEIVYKNAGRAVLRLMRTVPADGKQLTLDLRSAGEKASLPLRWLVFERE